MADWWDCYLPTMNNTWTGADTVSGTDTTVYTLADWAAADIIVDPIPNYLDNSIWEITPLVPKVIDDWWDIWGEILYD